MENRKGDWMQTVSGRRFYPLDPRPEEIHIEDIAHGLSQICRFGGHVLRWYSVAQHSIHVSKLVAKEWQMVALLHDATEAYIGDMIRPIKRMMPAFSEMEDRVWRAVCERFSLPFELPPEVKHADNVALMTERRDIVYPTCEIWQVTEIPDQSAVIEPVGPMVAKQLFIGRFLLLGGDLP